MARPAFNQGQTPSIAVFNKATVSLGLNLPGLIAALQVYVDKYVTPIWGPSCKLVATKGFRKGYWAVVFLDDADAANALAYHDLTPDGFPISKVFVRTIQNAGESVSVTASHELVEMLVDPAINLMTLGPDSLSVYAYETADPVEATFFKVSGFDMSNFVYPAYFETFHKSGSVKFDQMGLVKRPFQILRMGYQIIFKNGAWSNVFGSVAKKAAFLDEDRRGHRSAYRQPLGTHSGGKSIGKISKPTNS